MFNVSYNNVPTIPNPNPIIETTNQQQRRASASQTTQDQNILDLCIIFQAQISSAALATAKIQAKVYNLNNTIELKDNIIDTKNWQPHIINQVKHLDLLIQDNAATTLIKNEIDILKEKIQLLNLEIDKVKSNLNEIIKSTLFKTFQRDMTQIISSQSDNLGRLFNSKLLAITASFEATRLNQEQAKEAKAASKLQKTKDLTDEEILKDQIKSVVRDELKDHKVKDKTPKVKKSNKSSNNKPNAKVKVNPKQKANNSNNPKVKTNNKKKPPVKNSRKDF